MKLRIDTHGGVVMIQLYDDIKGLLGLGSGRTFPDAMMSLAFSLGARP